MIKNALLIFSVALILVCLGYVSFQWQVAEDSSLYYGLPFPWIRNSLAFSLMKEIYLLMVLANILVCSCLSFFALNAIKKLSLKKQAIIEMSVFLCGFFVLISISIFFSVYEFDFYWLPDF
jgi:hypothetical protein